MRLKHALAFLLVAFCHVTPLSARSDESPNESQAEMVRRLVDQRLREIDAEKKALEEKKEAETEQRSPDILASDSTSSTKDMKAVWNHGLELATPNKDFRIHVGGRYQFDAVWVGADDNVQHGAGGIGSVLDGVDFRRGRFLIEGTLWKVFDWAAEFDFVGSINTDPNSTVRPVPNSSTANVPVPTDLWVQINSLPVVGNLRIGHMKEPIGFEHMISSRFLPFLERSFNQDAFNGRFNNGFSPGVMFWNTMCEERASWWLGAFRNVQNVNGFEYDDRAYAVTGRLTALPVYEAEGAELVHVGIAGSYRILEANAVRMRARGPLRPGSSQQWPIYADTGTLSGDDEVHVDFEFAAVRGPWSLAADYEFVIVDDAAATGSPATTAYFHGGYVQVMCFLTGEFRPYNRKTAAFGRVVPHENFFLAGDSCGHKLFGRGAWEVGARYNYLDLTDDSINGNILHSWTLGLNWYLNPNLKIQWNYDVTYRDATAASSDSSGLIHGLGTRMAFDF